MSLGSVRFKYLIQETIRMEIFTSLRLFDMLSISIKSIVYSLLGWLPMIA